MRLSENFYRREFACKCGCGLDSIEMETVEVLQAVRDHFGVPVSITSGLRCKAHNARVGGAPRSQHLTGRAADIKVHGVMPRAVYEWLVSEYPGRYGVGLYSTFVHVDTRPGAARWRG